MIKKAEAGGKLIVRSILCSCIAKYSIECIKAFFHWDRGAMCVSERCFPTVVQLLIVHFKVFVRSSDYNRTIMSAQANMAGGLHLCCGYNAFSLHLMLPFRAISTVTG